MSIRTAVRALANKTKKNFPGANESDVAAYVTSHVTLILANPKLGDDEISALAVSGLDEAANANEAWAVNLRDSVLLNVVKPIVDAANAKGVDPVPALVLSADLDITPEQAEAYVTALEERATAPSIPAQSTDSDSDGDSASEQDDDEDEVSYDPAVTVSH